MVWKAGGSVAKYEERSGILSVLRSQAWLKENNADKNVEVSSGKEAT